MSTTPTGTQVMRATQAWRTAVYSYGETSPKAIRAQRKANALRAAYVAYLAAVDARVTA